MHSKIFTSLFFLLTLVGVQQTQAQCNIFDLVATHGDCINGEYYVTIDFEYDNVGNEGFHVQGGGNQYGNFEYANLPITLGPFPGNGTGVFEFVAIDNQHPDCSDFGMVGPVSCTGGNCDIFDFVAEPGDCNSDGTYQLWLDFEVDNPGNEYFDVKYQGVNIGFFEIADLPVVIEHFNDNGNPDPVILVCINDTPDCCAEDGFAPPNCNGGDCNIFDMTAVAGDCIDGMFYVTIDFQYENVGDDGFKIQGNGVNYGVFSYDDLPVVLGPFAGNGTTQYEFLAKDANLPDCSDFVDLGIVDCPPTGNCDIFGLVADTGDCNSDGTYNVAINFNVTNTNNNFFKVTYQGVVIANHIPIANLPYVIHNFQDNGEDSPVLVVCMSEQPDCCAEVEFQAPDCQPSDCNIFDVVAEAQACDDQGMFLLNIDFATQNVGAEGFKITANGVVYGPFDYGEPYYTIGPLQSGVLYEIIVQDLENPDCHKLFTLAPVNCNGDCHIFDLVAEVSDCNDQGQFFVTIDFQYNDVGNDGFKIFGNGNVYGFFDYDDLPVTIGPLTTDNEQLEFGAADVQYPGCHDFAVVETPDCGGSGNDDCQLYDLVAEVHPCLPNGTFYVTLDFQYENTGDFFKAQGNGIVYGIFSYDDLPVEIGPLVGNGTTPYEFVVRDLHQPDCADDISIGTVECAGGGDCEIQDLIADPGECNPDDTYNLWIWFDYENPGNNFYDVYHNGDFVDYFHLSHIPTTLPHLTANDEPLQTVTVCINDNPDCCQSVQYEAPDCDGLVWPGDPNFDNQSNHFDLLNLGLAFGAAGPHRAVQGIEWTGLQAENWELFFADNLNFKHADCNGDGEVSEADLIAVQNNFGETHGEPLAPVFVTGDENDPPFFVDLPEASDLTPGSIFSAPILLGTPDAPLETLYGIAFTLKFDPEIIDPASVELLYDPSWLGVKDVNLLTLDKTFADAGEIKVALVRKDQNNVSGYGQIAGIIGIIDNIAGKETASIEINDVKAIRENESLVSLRTPVEVVDLTANGTGEVVESGLTIFPNPASTSVFFTLPGGLTAETAELRDVNGKLVSLQNIPDNRLNISKLTPGVYFLKVKSGERFFQNKVVKF